MPNNSEFIEEYIKCLKFNNIWDALAIKDTDSNILYCTDYFAELFEVAPNNLIGAPMSSEMITATLSELYKKQDQVVFDTLSKHYFLNIIKTGETNHKLCFTTKLPIINKYSNTLEGVTILVDNYHYNIDKLQIFKYIHKLTPSITKRDHMEPPKLSKREQEILFLLIHGYTAKQCAIILHQIEAKVITESTVKTIILRLKEKFNAFNLQTLIQKSIAYGYENLIPVSFIDETALHICEPTCC